MIFLYVVKRGKKLSFFIYELILISHHNVTYNDVITTFAFPLFLSMIDTQHSRCFFHFPQLSLLRAYFFRITPSLSSSFLIVNLFR